MRTMLGMCAVVVGLTLAVPSAEALSEWWAPSAKKCPAFDSEEACEAWCAEVTTRCGGSAQ